MDERVMRLAGKDRRRVDHEHEIIVTPAEFALTHADGSGIPIIIVGGEVCEPAAVFFYHRRMFQGAPSATMLQEAHIIREFFSWIHTRSTAWQDVTDLVLAKWSRTQTSLQQKRIERKCRFVFHFYHLLQRIGYVSRVLGTEHQIIGAAPGSQIHAEPVESVVRKGTGRGRTSKITWHPTFERPTSAADPRPRRRPTPSAVEVQAVMDGLLRAGLGYKAVRTWFCAKYMAGAGLRREGVASLSTEKLEAALLREEIAVPRPRTSEERATAIAAGWNPRLTGLAALSNWPEAQDAIVKQIQILAGTRDHLYVSVVEKGRKERTVQVPIALFVATLRIWIWRHRAQFIENVRSRRPGWSPPSALWLSETKHQAMTRGAIGNAVKLAFKNGIKDPTRALSGHRLRAYYISDVIKRLYRKARAIQGRVVDIGAILDQACELAGHEHRETLKYYLDQEVTAGLSLPGQTVLVVDKADAEMIRGLAEALNDGNAEVRTVIRDVVAAFRFDAIPEPHSPEDAAEAYARHERRHNEKLTARRSPVSLPIDCVGRGRPA